MKQFLTLHLKRIPHYAGLYLAAHFVLSGVKQIHPGLYDIIGGLSIVGVVAIFWPRPAELKQPDLAAKWERRLAETETCPDDGVEGRRESLAACAVVMREFIRDLKGE